MSMWSYPAGAVINGVPTTERTVRPALPFTDLEGDQHGPEVFTAWPLADLNALGIKEFIEDGVPADHIPGVPVDTDQGGRIHRAYPNATPNLPVIREKKRLAIQGEKNRARDGGFDVNGVHFDSDTSARLAYAELAMRLQAEPTFTTQWKASEGVWVTMNAALFAQVYTAGAAHIAACFAWQEARETELAAATTLAEIEAVSTTYA